MAIPSRTQIMLASGFCTDIIIADQITKWCFATYKPEIIVIPDFLKLFYVENRGIAFSLPLTGLPLQIVTIILLGLIIYAIKKYKVYQDIYLYVCVMMILGGALGNAIDRIFRGFVVDFISIGSFPVFNVADSFVTIGGVGLVGYLWWKERKTPGASQE
ncbi:MAG: signal peptidase II [Candidatus Gracilibacteria bacterium]